MLEKIHFIHQKNGIIKILYLIKTRDRGVCTEMVFSFTPEQQDVVDLTKESNLTETDEVISESKNAERVGPAVSVYFKNLNYNKVII